MADPISVADLRLEHFAGRIGEGFEVRLPNATERLVLENTLARANHGCPVSVRPGFSIFLRGSTPTILLQQGTYPLEHEEMGRLDIFIVPIGREPDGTFRYEACFS